MQTRDCNTHLIPTPGLMGRAEEIAGPILRIVIGAKTAIQNLLSRILISVSFVALLIGACQPEMN